MLIMFLIKTSSLIDYIVNSFFWLVGWFVCGLLFFFHWPEIFSLATQLQYNEDNRRFYYYYFFVTAVQ